jgi:hypothetical protein
MLLLTLRDRARRLRGLFRRVKLEGGMKHALPFLYYTSP